ncbi:hypothetical protein QYF36_022126 [Acer negundo]|nr:hypothetical protein QYF36_022126 [Acer negundo]
MRNQLIDSLKTPEEERYSGKITRHDHFDNLTNIDNVLNKVPEHLAIEERRRHSVRFSKIEFCLIIGLKFGELPDTSTYDMVENGIHQRYFEGRNEVEYAELKAVLRIGVFSEQYNAIKLCLLYMLNWILMGQSIYGFKHALDGRRRRFEQRQRRKGVDVHTTETYNIYGLTHALLVIPELGNSRCGKRREIKLSPRILKWELSTRPREEKLNSIFLESMFARVKLVPTATERAERYFEGISQGRSLYDVDVGDIYVLVSDLERYTTAGTSDTEGPSFEPSDTEGSDLDGRHICPARTIWVRFTLPREPRTRDDSRTGDDSRGGGGGGVGGQAELQEEVRKSNEKRDQQHQELLDLIRELQEQEPQQVLPDQPVHSQDLVQSTSLQHTPPVDPSAEHPFIHSIGTEIPSLSAPKELTPTGDRRRHSSYLQCTPAGDTEGQSPSTHRTSRGNTWGQSSSLQLTHPVDRIELDRIPPPIQRQDRVHRPGWQQRTLYNDPSRPKRTWIRPQPPHVWAPHVLIGPDHVAAHQAYKRNSTGELRDVDLLEPVGVPWSHRFQTNIMEFEDTHMDAYLHILRKRQRYYSTVYGPRINILDSQFYSWLLNDWERLMGSGADKPRHSWSLFKHQWSINDLKVIRGLVMAGTKPWNEVDVVLIPCNLGRTHWALASVDLTTRSIYLMDPFRQEVPFRYRKTQLVCLRSFLPSMLHAVDFHGRRRRGDMTYTLQNKPFPLNIVFRDRVPQQDRGGNYGAHTLRLIEYMAANRDTFDWLENEMGTIQEKLAVEVFCNSKDWSSS